MQVLLQARRLAIAGGLPEAATLMRELGQFKARPAPTSGDAVADWREGPQDDLVLAVAVAVWQGEREEPDAGRACPYVLGERPAWSML